jgi:hypothetical protein
MESTPQANCQRHPNCINHCPKDLSREINFHDAPIDGSADGKGKKPKISSQRWIKEMRRRRRGGEIEVNISIY